MTYLYNDIGGVTRLCTSDPSGHLSQLVCNQITFSTLISFSAIYDSIAVLIMEMSRLIETLQKNNYIDARQTKHSKFWASLFANPTDSTWFVLGNPPEFTNELLVLLKTPEHATGHSGISHGGFIATLFDEPLCYAAYPILPHHTGVTASLTVNYLQPIQAGSWVLLKAEATGKEGSRKVIVNAHLYAADLSGATLPWADTNPLATATQIVVEPRWHDKLDYK